MSRVVATAMLIACVLSIPSVCAASVLRKVLQAKVRMADVVLVGSVTETRAGIVSNSKQAWTASFVIEKVLKGNVLEKRITVTYWLYPEGVITSANPPQLARGRHVLFLSTKGGKHELITPFHGAKPITERMGAFDESRKGETVIGEGGGHSSIDNCPYVEMTEDEYVAKICVAAGTEPIIVSAPLPPPPDEPGRAALPGVVPLKSGSEDRFPSWVVPVASCVGVALALLAWVVMRSRAGRQTASQPAAPRGRAERGP